MNRKKYSAMTVIVAISLIASIVIIQPDISEASESKKNISVTRDSQIILLQGKSLPANDFLHLYDTTPYMIMNGHVAARVPCDKNSQPSIQILLGHAPDLKPAELELISELSQPGKLCLYHADVKSSDEQVITDIAISNPGKKPVTFSASSTVVIGINEIMPGAKGHIE